MLSPFSTLMCFATSFNLFFGILFSGTTSPGSFRDIYSDKFIEFIASFFSPPRYFIETMMVSEFRVLPSQTGMTLQADMAPGLPFNVMDDVFKIGQKDMPNASTQSYNGWYQLFLAPFLVGITVRFLGAVLVSVVLKYCTKCKNTVVPLTRRQLTFSFLLLRSILATDHNKRNLPFSQN